MPDRAPFDPQITTTDGDEILDETIEELTDDNLDPDQPWNLPYWGTLGGHPIGSSYPAASLERNFSVSATTLQNTIGAVHGDGRRLSGFVGLVYNKPAGQKSFVHVAVFWSEGELPPSGIAGMEVNGEDASAVPWIVSIEHFLGSDSQSASTDLISALGGQGFVEAYPGYAYSVLIIDTSLTGAPTTFSATAVLLGRLIVDYRTGSRVSGGNPALVMYDILTDEEIWLGLPTSLIPTPVGGTWREAADHCDEVMSDGTPRYSFNGRITERRPPQALRIVGDHSFMKVFFIRGEFQVKTMECPVAIRSEVIEAGDWRATPKWREIPQKTVMNSLLINYTNELDWKAASIPIEDPAGVSGSNMIQPQVTLPGCITRSAANRWGTKKFNHHNLERFQWMGYVQEAKIAEVLPGHIITIYTPEGVENQPARVERLKELGDGWILIELTEYDPNTDSEAVATDDTPISIDGGYSTIPPDPPTAVTRELGELGAWSDRSEFDDPNDLTGADWDGYDLPAPTLVYDGVNEWTELTPTVAGGGAPANELLHFLTAANPSSDRYIKATVCVALDSGSDADAEIAVVYKTGTSPTGPFTERYRRNITPANVGTGTLLRWSDSIPWDLTGDTYHLVGLELTAGTNTWAVKRFHAVEWQNTPALNGEVLELFQRWGWLEDIDADTEVLTYQARRWKPNGAPGLIIAEVSQGETQIEFSEVTTGLIGFSGGRTFSQAGIASWAVWLWLNAVNTTVSEFPDPTTTFNIDPPPIAPTGVAMVWRRGPTTGQADEDKADNWGTLGTAPTIVTDIDTTPLGNATADRVTFTANGEIQNEEEVTPQPAAETVYMLGIWAKTFSGAEKVVQLKSGMGALRNEKYVVIHGEWRFFRIAHQWSATEATPVGCAIKSTDADLVVCGAKWWTLDDDTSLQDGFEVSWTPASDASSLDRYELQYRPIQWGVGINPDDWVAHALIPKEASSVAWGNLPQAIAPHFPHQEGQMFDVHLYDWRLVAIRGDHITPFEPTTVTEIERAIGSDLSKATDFDGVPVEDGILAQNLVSNRWVTSSKTATTRDLAETDTDESFTSLLIANEVEATNFIAGAGSAANPAYELGGDGSGNGLYMSGSNFALALSGVHYWKYKASELIGNGSTGPSVKNRAGTRTLANFVHNRSSSNTGRGGQAGEISDIVVGVEQLRMDANGVATKRGVSAIVEIISIDTALDSSHHSVKIDTAAKTATLPDGTAAAHVAGREYFITNSSGSPVFAATTAGQTIGGQTGPMTIAPSNPYATLHVKFDGVSDWIIQ